MRNRIPKTALHQRLLEIANVLARCHKVDAARSRDIHDTLDILPKHDHYGPHSARLAASRTSPSPFVTSSSSIPPTVCAAFVPAFVP